MVVAEMIAPDHRRKGSVADQVHSPIAPLPVQRAPPQSGPVNPDMADISTAMATASAASN